MVSFGGLGEEGFYQRTWVFQSLFDNSFDEGCGLRVTAESFECGEVVFQCVQVAGKVALSHVDLVEVDNVYVLAGVLEAPFGRLEQ